MTRARTTLILLLFAAAGCDSGPAGPADGPVPGSIELGVERTRFDWVGQTAQLEARVRTEDGDLLLDPPVTWISRRPSVAPVDSMGVVTGLTNGQGWVIGRAGDVQDSMRFTVASPVPCSPTATLTVPDTVADELVPGDCGPEARYREVWQLEVPQGGLITLDLHSADFNAFILLLNEDGQAIGADNNTGDGLDARLIIEVPAGTYYVLVGPYTAGVAGSYELQVIRGAPPTPCPPTATVSFPDTVTGSTAAGACAYEGYDIDVWRFDLADSAAVTVQLVGDGIGMIVVVTDTIGRPIFGGFEGPGDGGWAEETLPPGPYDIWVIPRQEGATGSYTLQVNRGPSTLHCPIDGSVAINGIGTGALDDNDCYAWYAPSDGWALEVADTTDVTLSVSTTGAISPAILVTDSTGALVGVGYQDLEHYARHDTTMVPGSYRVWVQSADLENGDYQLSVVEAGEVGACPANHVAVLDSTFEDALSTTDCTLIDGRYADGWTLQIDTTSYATIDLISDKFDPYLIVTDSAGTIVGRDDDSGDGVNASLTLQLDPGDYTVWATAYAGNTIGGYSLVLATATAAARVDGDGGRGKAGLSPWPVSRMGEAAGSVLEPPPTWLERLQARAASGGGIEPSP